MSKKIRVIVADDSALMRKKIREILDSDPHIEVIATVRNGEEAIKSVYNLRPDVVTLDVAMPILDGLQALGYIMSECPTPCVMISAFTREGTKETIRSLEFGAVDFVTKPGGVISPDIAKCKKEIIEKVRLAAKVPIKRLKLLWPKRAEEKVREPVVKKPTAISKVFIIASSTGGTQALATVLPRLRSDLKAAVLVVQHMPEGFTKSLAERLNWQSKISIVEAEDKMLIKPGQVIIAKGGLHIEISGTREGAHVVLSKKSPSLGVRPSADILMKSAAGIFKDKTIGIVLTGMGSDGTAGSKAIKEAGGLVIAEEKSSCVIYGMPKSVIEKGIADKVAPLHKIADQMEGLV